MEDGSNVTMAENLDATISHYYDMGRFEKVIELLQMGLATDAENAYYHYLWGVCCLNLDRYSEVRDHLEEALRLGLEPVFVNLIFGHLYKETKQWQEAERAYLGVLADDPTHATAHAAYAYVMLKTGHDEKAHLLMRKAIEFEPENPEVIRYRHMFSLATGTKDDQIQALEQYMQVADSEVGKELHLGLQAHYNNRPREAMQHFKQAYLLDPTNKNLKKLLSQQNARAHRLLAPLRFVRKIGGRPVLYVVAMGSILLTKSLGWYAVSGTLAVLYVLFAVYTWIAVAIVRSKLKRTR